MKADTKIILNSSNKIKPYWKKIRDKIKCLENEIRKYDTGAFSRFQYIKILDNKYKPRRII
jgi:hypothetical protein